MHTGLEKPKDVFKCIISTALLDEKCTNKMPMVVQELQNILNISC